MCLGAVNDRDPAFTFASSNLWELALNNPNSLPVKPPHSFQQVPSYFEHKTGATDQRLLLTTMQVGSV